MPKRTDKFNRTDNTSAIGKCDQGVTWDAETTGDTWGIYQNIAYHSGAVSPSIATLESDASDVETEVTITDAPGGAYGLCFRVYDQDNYLCLYVYDDVIAIVKFENGTPTNLDTYNSGGVVGDTFRVRALGDSLEAYQNDVLRCSVTSTFNQTATRHGLYNGGTTGTRWEDFSLTPLTGVVYDLGINFRETDIGSTDPIDTTYCLNEVYPVTRGGSTFGWHNAGGPATPGGVANRTNVDPRLGGVAFAFNGTPLRFRLDGLEPGLVTIHLAMGDTDAHGPQSWQILDSDGSTVLDDVTTPALTASTYYDATGVGRTAADWGTTEVSKDYTISGNSIWIKIGESTSGGDYHTLAHFRAVQSVDAPSSLTPGTASFVKSGPSEILISATDATDGVGIYTYQWQRNEDGGSYSDLTDGSGVTGTNSLFLTDGSAEEGVLYGYRLVYTDDDSTNVTSNVVTAKIYTGGDFVSSVSYFSF